jgi:cytoskeletal protein CcmA (bactofilin family)
MSDRHVYNHYPRQAFEQKRNAIIVAWRRVVNEIYSVAQFGRIFIGAADMGSAWQNFIGKGPAANVVELVADGDRASQRRDDAEADVVSLEAVRPAAVADHERAHIGVTHGIDGRAGLANQEDNSPTSRALGQRSEEGQRAPEKDYGAPLLSETFVEQLALRIANILNEAHHAKNILPAPAEPVAYERATVAEAYAQAAQAPSTADPAEDAEADVPEQNGAPVSHIAAGATVSGGIHDYGDGAVCVGGKFTPEKLTCGDLTILAGASVRGDIYSSGLVKIFGNVDETQILAKAIELYDGAEVNGGSLKSETIGIQVGAHISGAITTRTMRNNAE